MNRYDLYFLVLATLTMIVGVAMGIFMAASQDFQMMPIHAHLNLVGWVSLALFGLVYRAYPVLSTRRLARAHLMLSAPSALLLPMGIGLAIFAQSEVLAIVASLMWLAGAVLFLLQLLSLFAPAPAVDTMTALPAE